MHRSLSPAEAKAWNGLLHAHDSIVRDLDRQLRAADGLPLSWYDVLCEVASVPEDGVRMGELADRVLLTRAGLSGLVDRLERAHLIERRPSTATRAARTPSRPPRDDRLLHQAEQTHWAAVRGRYTGCLDNTELALLGHLWDRVAGQLRAEAHQPLPSSHGWW